MSVCLGLFACIYGHEEAVSRVQGVWEDAPPPRNRFLSSHGTLSSNAGHVRRFSRSGFIVRTCSERNGRRSLPASLFTGSFAAPGVLRPTGTGNSADWCVSDTVSSKRVSVRLVGLARPGMIHLDCCAPRCPSITHQRA